MSIKSPAASVGDEEVTLVRLGEEGRHQMQQLALLRMSTMQKAAQRPQRLKRDNRPHPEPLGHFPALRRLRNVTWC